MASSGEADLALELERGVGTGRGGSLEIRVVEHDEGVVAAELERDLLEQAAGQLAHPAARGGRPGERHGVDVGVGDDRLAGLRAADDDVEQPVGQPGLAEHGLEHGPAADGRLRIWLEDHGIAQREGRGDHPHPQDRGRVPGRDRPDHPERHPANHGQPPSRHGRHERSVRLPGHGCRVVHLRDGEVLLVVHLAVDGARLPLRPAAELVPVCLVDLGRAPEDAGALGVVGLRPGRLSGRGGRRGAGDVFRGRLREGEQRASGRGLADLAGLAGTGRPVGEERVEPAGGGGGGGHDVSSMLATGGYVAVERRPVAGSRHTAPRASTLSIEPSSMYSGSFQE